MPAAPLTLSIPVEHADSMLSALAGGLRATPPGASIGAAPIRALPPGPMSPPANLTPAGLQGPLPAMTPVHVGEAPSLWNRFLKPIAMAAGSSLVPEAMPFIPGTPQHIELEQEIEKRQLANELAKGEMPGQIAQQAGLGQQQVAKGGVLGQEAAGKIGTSTARQAAVKANQAALGYRLEQSLTRPLLNPQPPANSGNTSLEGNPFNLPQVISKGPITDQNVNDWMHSAENLSMLGGFVPQLNPLATLANRTAGSEELLAREQNANRVGAMSAEVKPLYTGALNSFAASGYNVEDPQVQQAAMLLAMSHKASAGVPTRASTHQVVEQTPSGPLVTNLNSTSGPGIAMGNPGQPAPPIQTPAGEETHPLTNQAGLPVLPKPSPQQAESINGLNDVLGLMHELQPIAEQLAQTPGNGIVRTKLHNILYNFGITTPADVDKYIQLSGLGQAVGALALGRGGSRNFQYLEMTMQHLADPRAEPAETAQRVNYLLNTIYPVLMKNVYTSTYKDAAGIAAAQDKVTVDMPDVYHPYYEAPKSREVVPIAKYNGHWINAQTGAKVPYTGH
ncbi:MAG: hypothetical protein ACRD22_01200 [Terriglobia bacterium]